MEELNRLWAVYLEEYYHKRKHAGIAEYYESLGVAVSEEGISPLQEWNRGQPSADLSGCSGGIGSISPS